MLSGTASADFGGKKYAGTATGVIDGFVYLGTGSVSYTHLRAHETVLDLVCRLLLEKKKIPLIYVHINTHKQSI